MKSIKKIFIRGITFLFSMILLFIACGNSDSSQFHRVKSVFQGSPDESTVKFINDLRGNKYINLKQTAFPVYKSGNSIKIKNNTFRADRLYISIYSDQKNKMFVILNNNVIEKKNLKAGFNEISLNVGFDNIIEIKIEGDKSVWFSSPVIYNSNNLEKNLIFLISVDTLGASHLDVYNPEKNTSPNITKFADDSVLFVNTIANSSYTPSSHMSIFTSQYEFTHGLRIKKNYKNDVKIDDSKYIVPVDNNVLSLADILAEQYVMISYNGGGNVGPQFGFFRGFDLWRAARKDYNDVNASQKLFKRVKKNISRNKFQSAFYFLHTYHLHAPYNPEKIFFQDFDIMKLKKFDFNADLGGVRNIYKDLGNNKRENISELYDSEIRSFDQYFGDFISFLKKLGLYNSSMIILTSDHGEEFYEHGSWTHGTSLYNDQIKVPLIIKFPDQKFKKIKINKFVSLVDILPTICDYYEIEIPAKIEGVSLLSYLRTDKIPDRIILSSLYLCKPYEMIPGKIALITKGHKLIYNEMFSDNSEKFFFSSPPKLSKFELYDLINDPMERINLFEEPSSIKDTLLKKMVELIRLFKQKDKSVRNGIEISDEVKDQLKTLGYL